MGLFYMWSLGKQAPYRTGLQRVQGLDLLVLVFKYRQNEMTPMVLAALRKIFTAVCGDCEATFG